MAGHRLGPLGGRPGYLPPFQCISAPLPASFSLHGTPPVAQRQSIRPMPKRNRVQPPALLHLRVLHLVGRAMAVRSPH